MIVVAWLASILVASYCAYRIGRRVEIGKREVELARLEEVAHARSVRTGTIRLSTMQIRR